MDWINTRQSSGSRSTCKPRGNVGNVGGIMSVACAFVTWQGHMGRSVLGRQDLECRGVPECPEQAASNRDDVVLMGMFENLKL